MHADDLSIGRVLTRRESLALLASTGALVLPAPTLTSMRQSKRYEPA